MAPLLVSALVGVGVKIASDLLSKGFKQAFRSESPTASFASTLDKARAATGATPAGTPTPASTSDLGFGDRSRVLAAEMSGLPATARGYGVASYRRLDEVPQAI